MARKKSVSYSQFALWEQCPYSWKLQYVDKAIPWSDNIHTLFGTAMHEVLQEYIRVMYTKSIVEADKLLLEEELEDRMKKLFMEIMQRNGGEQFCTKDEMTEFYNDGLKNGGQQLEGLALNSDLCYPGRGCDKSCSEAQLHSRLMA